jgi:hypothetical protein
MACPKVDQETKNYFPFIVITYANELAVGAIIAPTTSILHSRTQRLIGCSTSKFKHAQINYSVHEKELMGVLLTVKKWNYFLEGRKFDFQNRPPLPYLA